MFCRLHTTSLLTTRIFKTSSWFAFFCVFPDWQNIHFSRSLKSQPADHILKFFRAFSWISIFVFAVATVTSCRSHTKRLSPLHTWSRRELSKKPSIAKIDVKSDQAYTRNARMPGFSSSFWKRQTSLLAGLRRYSLFKTSENTRYPKIMKTMRKTAIYLRTDRPRTSLLNFLGPYGCVRRLFHTSAASGGKGARRRGTKRRRIPRPRLPQKNGKWRWSTSLPFLRKSSNWPKWKCVKPVKNTPRKVFKYQVTSKCQLCPTRSMRRMNLSHPQFRRVAI